MAFAASGCMRADWGRAREEVMGELRTASRTGSKAGIGVRARGGRRGQDKCLSRFGFSARVRMDPKSESESKSKNCAREVIPRTPEGGGVLMMMGARADRGRNVTGLDPRSSEKNKGEAIPERPTRNVRDTRGFER